MGKLEQTQTPGREKRHLVPVIPTLALLSILWVMFLLLALATLTKFLGRLSAFPVGLPVWWYINSLLCLPSTKVMAVEEGPKQQMKL